MHRRLPTAPMVSALLAGAFFCSLTCSRSDEAGRAARATRSCEGRCRLVVRSEEQAFEDCRRGCMAQVQVVGRSCERQLWDWLDCERGTGAFADFVRGQQTSVTRACDTAFQRLRACTRSCGAAGIVQSGERRFGGPESPRHAAFEAKYHGCVPCVAERGAAAGAICAAAKVCAGHCFDCGDGRTTLSLRACVDGRCADVKLLEMLLSDGDGRDMCPDPSP